MTSFKNFIKDFPSRSLDLLTNFHPKAVDMDREVTLLLSVAATGLTFPFERLRKPPDGISHPSGDRKTHTRALGKFSNLSGKLFIGSELWPEMQIASWKIIEGLSTDEVQKENVPWYNDFQPINAQTIKVSVILDLIRNALAHGNIIVYPPIISSQIEEIMFLSRRYEQSQFMDEYNVLAVEPEDFRKFLKKWIHFLKTLKLSEVTHISQASVQPSP